MHIDFELHSTPAKMSKRQITARVNRLRAETGWDMSPITATGELPIIHEYPSLKMKEEKADLLERLEVEITKALRLLPTPAEVVSAIIPVIAAELAKARTEAVRGIAADVAHWHPTWQKGFNDSPERMFAESDVVKWIDRINQPAEFHEAASRKAEKELNNG